VVGVDTTAAGEHEGVVTIDSDGGSATIRVTVTVDPHPAPAPQPPTAAVGQPPTAGQTTDRGEPPPAWPHPPPEHPTRGRPRPRQDASPELGGDPRGYYQGDTLATWPERIGAALIDLLAVAPGLILLLWGLALLGGYDASAYGPGTAMAWIGLLYALLIIAYNRWRLQGRTGQSWGKRVLNLKLVRMADKTPIGGRMAFVRDLANLVDIWPLFGVGFLFPLWTVRRQTLPDKVMKTVVLSQGKTGSSASQTS
jgi:uncharacterized RDD family membrane protein YckC